MNIVTKFNIGQFVHPIILGNRWFCDRFDTVETIIVHKHYGVGYRLSHRPQYTLPERDLFPTVEEAQAECDRRNAEAA